MCDPSADLLRLVANINDPLARLVQADALARALRVLVRELALDANAAGYSWADIGLALGVSRSAAHERFSPGHTRAAGRRRRER